MSSLIHRNILKFESRFGKEAHSINIVRAARHKAIKRAQFGVPTPPCVAITSICGAIIGSGNSGTVYQHVAHPSYAVKVIKIEWAINGAMDEVRFLRLLDSSGYTPRLIEVITCEDEPLAEDAIPTKPLAIVEEKIFGRTLTEADVHSPTILQQVNQIMDDLFKTYNLFYPDHHRENFMYGRKEGLSEERVYLLDLESLIPAREDHRKELSVTSPEWFELMN